ncbi:hypothetical protein H7H80_12310 [Mycobacterium interjectum]|nr:hypothetical protein [Mycobacterium interjectum]MCV7090538.1 hypothetical protein [Mycobacterium interjectum]
MTVDVGGDDRGVVATEFEQHRGEAGGGRRHDRAPGGDAAGQRDEVDARVGDQRLGELAAGTGEHVDHTRRQRRRERGQPQRRQRQLGAP